MLFNSAIYVGAFLPAVTLLYWLLPSRPRLWLLLLASLTFYGFWRFDFIPLVLFSAMLDYVLALWIAKTANPGARRRRLLVSVTANLAILGLFKYFDFAVRSIGSVARLIGYEPGFVELNLILPLGISFYIFQTLSYTIDVYRGEIEPERDWLKYLCFVTFFAHMVAGPILRARVLLPQFGARPAFRSDFVIEGIERILAGLFLKVVLADNISGFVDDGFARNPADLSGPDVWTLAFLFGFQIFFDFAGYSSIAIGSARLLGITLPENFNFPYLATSPRDFWQRWHISLSTWVRDYIYLPLTGTFRSGKDAVWDAAETAPGDAPGGRRATALFATWLIMGLWHGANWTFAIWGLYHAALIQAQRLLLMVRPGPAHASQFYAIAGFVMTLPLIMASWIPFRSRTVSGALAMWGRLFDPAGYVRGSLGLAPNTYLLAAAVLSGMLAVWAWQNHLSPRLAAMPLADAGLSALYFAILIALVTIFLQVKSQFIYFQF